MTNALAAVINKRSQSICASLLRALAQFEHNDPDPRLQTSVLERGEEKMAPLGRHKGLNRSFILH
ncbi:hypothetical protein V6L77_14745 [Pannonibacter sp. Pt2-lr]